MELIDLTPVVQAVLALLATLVTARLIPWIKSRTTAQQQQALAAAADVLVYAAEQVYGAGHGAEKLAYVADGMAARGYAVDMAAIEAAVRRMALALPSKTRTVFDGGNGQGSA